jgi:hypothetical protein
MIKLKITGVKLKTVLGTDITDIAQGTLLRVSKALDSALIDSIVMKTDDHKHPLIDIVDAGDGVGYLWGDGIGDDFEFEILDGSIIVEKIK